MQELHRQYEGGQLTKDQAWEKTSEILKDHGVTPDNGREWSNAGREGNGAGSTEGRAGRDSTERSGFEHAWDRMSSEAREQLEGKFGSDVAHEGPGHSGERGSFERSQEQSQERGERGTERYSGGAERDHAAGAEREFGRDTPARETAERASREYTAPERAYATPEREYATPERSFEAPERTSEAPQREYEAPQREYTAPEPMREYQAPETQPR